MKSPRMRPMYKLFIKLTFLSTLITSVSAQRRIPALIPAPACLKEGRGVFVLSRATVVMADDPQDKLLVFLRQQLPTTLRQQPLPLSQTGPKDTILLTQTSTENLPPEGYKLEIRPSRIKITGRDAGLFYGVQTLLQLIPPTDSLPLRLPAMTIEDHPRFPYRGLMLDVSRHFFTVPQIKQVLDLMAAYKLNRFHWHLTDDNGWRIEIRSLPRLTDIGAWRVPRRGRFGTNEPPRPGEAPTEGGFYTQEEIREVIRYAADRYITIIPEIDIPGHCMAAIAAYPELCCTKDTSIKVNPGTAFGVWFGKGRFEMHIDNTLNPASEKVYEFLDKVFTEIAALFPCEYIHIGGDECYKGYWEKDSSVQEFIKANNFRNIEQLQSYFIRRVSRILENKHKKLAGWDETVRGDAAPGVALATCRWTDSAFWTAARQHDIVLTPGANGFYFDYAQSRSVMEPVSHGGNAPMQQIYDYNPAPDTLPPDIRRHILGIQGCLWTEHIPSMAKLEYMIIPRIFALAEVAWSPEKKMEYPDFLEHRVGEHLAKMERWNFNYRVPQVLPAVDTTLTGANFHFNFKPVIPGEKIFYTLDGHDPSPEDWMADGPLSVDVPAGKQKELKVIRITQSGKRSVVSRVVMASK